MNPGELSIFISTEDYTPSTGLNKNNPSIHKFQIHTGHWKDAWISKNLAKVHAILTQS